MAILEATYYYAACDGCGHNITADGEYSAWGDAGAALDDVTNGDGFVASAGGVTVVLCADCAAEYRSPLPDEEWDALADEEPAAVTRAAAWATARKTAVDERRAATLAQGYPTLAQVAAADQRQLLAWSRFLPSPTDENRQVLDAILLRSRELRTADPAAFTAASKAVGW